MKKIIIVTKPSQVDFSFLSSQYEYEVVYFDKNFDSNLKVEYPNLLTMYTDCDELWVWDVYFENLNYVISLLLKFNEDNGQIFNSLSVFTFQMLNTGLFDKWSQKVTLKVAQPFTAHTDKKEAAIQEKLYLKSFIKNLKERIQFFKSGIESKWEGYFKTEKIYIPEKSYVELNINGTAHCTIIDLIFQICEEFNIVIEWNNEMSNRAISKLFYLDFLIDFESLNTPVKKEVSKELKKEVYDINVSKSDTTSKTPLLNTFSNKTAIDTERSFRYFTSEKKEKAIIIINALGISISLWQNLIEKLRVHFQIILWETQCGHIDDGGMEAVVTIDEHAKDIETIIKQEKLNAPHIIAWCNGARIGVKVASYMEIGNLIFIAPSFKGISKNKEDNTKFEKQMDDLFHQVKRNPKSSDYVAMFFKKIIDQQLTLKNISEEELLGFNSKEYNPHVFRHLFKGNYLMNHEKRAKNDHNYDIIPFLEKIDKKVLFILGENDGVVSNDLIKQVTDKFHKKDIVTILGGSHYIHLQNASLVNAIILNFLGGYQLYEFISHRIQKTSNKESFII